MKNKLNLMSNELQPYEKNRCLSQSIWSVVSQNISSPITTSRLVVTASFNTLRLCGNKRWFNEVKLPVVVGGRENIHQRSCVPEHLVPSSAGLNVAGVWQLLLQLNVWESRGLGHSFYLWGVFRLL